MQEIGYEYTLSESLYIMLLLICEAKKYNYDNNKLLVPMIYQNKVYSNMVS